MGFTRFFRRRHWDAERTREIETYIENETADNIARGMAPEEARHAAYRKFGNPTFIREEIYSMNSIGLLESIWQDLRHAARLLRLNPAFALVAILSLGLGIGANTAIFQLLDAVRMRTLPVRNPQNLARVLIVKRTNYSGWFAGRYGNMTYPLWEQIREHQQAFSGVFAWGTAAFNLSPSGERRMNNNGLWVSGEFFPELGVQPLLGRLLTPEDDRPACASPGVVISSAFWKREFVGAPSAVGSKLILNGRPMEVLGVTPPEFYGPEVGRSYDIAVPFCAETALEGESGRLQRRDAWWLVVMGRLKPRWSLEQASSQLSSISPGIFQATLPDSFNPVEAKQYLAYKLFAYPAESGVTQLDSRPLWLLLAISGLVLLIACVNLANLMLARSSVRAREFAVRLAIGASRGRLIRQLLSESLLLAMLGASLAVVLTRSLGEFLISIMDASVYLDLAPDWRVFAFTAGVAGLTCLLFGLTPALHATRTDPHNTMKTGGRGLTAARERFSVRRMLVVSQVALAMVLLVGAILFSATFHNMLTMDAGFRQDGILDLAVSYGKLNLSPEQRPVFRAELLRRIRNLPQVESAATARIVPAMEANWDDKVYVGAAQQGESKINRVSSGYFQALETPLLSGRDFNDYDTPSSPPVAIVNEKFARQILGTTNPLGRTFHFEGDAGEKQPVYQVVGLARDSKFDDLRDDVKPIAFIAESQNAQPEAAVTILIHSTAPLADLTGVLKRTLTEFSPQLSFRFAVFRTEVRGFFVRERLMASLSSFFGVLAVILAIIGLYGVVSYMVTRRTNEIGIRVALGASRTSVVGLVLREAAILVTAGLTAGTLLSLALAQTAASLLYGLQPRDPAVILLAITILATVAIAASYLPAHRAASLDPVAALREE
ncbi:MAG TPA: ABC transporter permease [Bryobacteraceae bacterium]|nr:ABC transporter permease [Bryobacteraceae bacterium]